MSGGDPVTQTHTQGQIQRETCSKTDTDPQREREKCITFEMCFYTEKKDVNKQTDNSPGPDTVRSAAGLPVR